MAKIAINGFGRIGRAALKIIRETPELELVAINDIVPTDNLAYLLKYDTVYGRYPESVDYDEQNLIVGGDKIRAFNEKDPANLPWGEMGVDIVIESTGVFTKMDDLQKHIQAGARYVLLSAPAKDEKVNTFIYGVNRPDGETRVFSCASCTTNSISPVIEIIGRRIGIKKAIMTTLHAYTASQKLVDAPSKKFRRGRAAAANLVPTTTGAAVATAKAMPEYKGKFDGLSIRAPIPVGSIADITIVTERPTTPEEVNQIFEEETQTERYREVIRISHDPIVSSDIIQEPYASVVDAEMTMVVDGDLLKVMSWYDNEWGFTSQMVRQAREIARELEKGVGVLSGRG